MNGTAHVTRGVFSVRRIGGALLGLALTAAAGLAQPGPGKVLVADVIPKGNFHVPTQRITSTIKTHPGGDYNPETVAEDVRQLYKTGLFADVRTAEERTPDGKVIVYFYFAELPSTIQEIVYNGANHIKQDELDSITGLRRGAPLNPIANQLARNAILKKYQEDGRLSATVDLAEGGKPGDTRVVFNITEGPKAKVGAIDFVGNAFVTGARLRTQVNSSRTFLGIGGTFNPFVADLDIVKLEEYYRGFGFHDVRVSRELNWDLNQRYVRLVFHVNEGTRYKISKVDVQGVDNKVRDELMTFNDLKPGDNYSQMTVDVDRNRIKDWYGNRGYNTTVQEAVYYPQDHPGEVVLQYNVQEKPVPDRVGQVFVIGNDVTKQNVILRQVPLYPGQILTYPDLRAAERNLARLGIFEGNPEAGVRPTVSVINPDDENPVKDIEVRVQETRTGSLIFGVGVNSDAGLNGSIVLNEKNFDILRPPTSFEDLLSGKAFRGAGQEFRVEAVPGTDVQRYTVSWREPFLFDSPYSLGVSGYYYDRVFNEYTEERLGARVTVGRKLNQYWTASGTVRVEDVGVHNVPYFAPPDFQDVQGQNLLVGLRGAITRDTRDSYLRPTEGNLVDISYEQILGDFTFPEVNVEANQYVTVLQRADGSGRHVLALHSQVGWVGTEAPVFERFYAGGFRSMRGFEFRGVGPDVGGFKVGGDFMFLNSAEYQIPVRANDQIYLVGFVDSGTVERRVEINDYRVTAGVGVRIIVPLLGPVPIALDFGFPIVKAPQDNEQIFSFWVGFFH